MPQCGLAPGFISIAANALIQHFDEIRSVKLRVGALPQHPNNVLKYSLTWSTDGLINEYGNPCEALVDGRDVEVAPLEGLEEIEIDGTLYEAFNTSGGLGSLADTYGSKVQTMDYKTIRYPGHCAQMRLLMNDLKLNQDRATLKRVLENAVPQTLQDVVIVYVAVAGRQDGELREENYVSKIYPQMIAGRLWSAIQVTTAAGITAVVDLVLRRTGPLPRLRAPGRLQPRRRARQPLRPALRRRRLEGNLGAHGRGRHRQDSSAWRAEVHDERRYSKDLGLEAVNAGTWSADGGWLSDPAAQRIDSINPATGEVIASVRGDDARAVRAGDGLGREAVARAGARYPRRSAAKPCA